MKYSIAILSLCAFPALANVEITGSVEAKCVIQTTKSVHTATRLPAN